MRHVSGRRMVVTLALSAACLGVSAFTGSSSDRCVPPGQWVAPQPDSLGVQPSDRVLARLAQRQVVLLGETHDDAEHHRWQLHTIAGLHALHLRMVLGFEMFPRRVQPILDQWVAGLLGEQELLARTEWDKVWGYDAQLYLPILHFARMHRVPMLALNVERRLISRIKDEGWAAIPPAEREGVSDPLPASDEYARWLYQSYLDHQPAGEKKSATVRTPSEAELNDPPYRRFVEAMLVWDRAMAQRIAGRLDGAPIPLVVAIMGSGHLRDGHGVPRQLRDLGVKEVAVGLPWDPHTPCADLRPGLADALFGIEEIRQASADRPRLGISITRSQDGVIVQEVIRDSIAERAGLQKGDLITQIAGEPVGDPSDVVAAVRRHAPGTWLPLVVKRGPNVLEIVARFPSRP